jgi:hypothetical protein
MQETRLADHSKKGEAQAQFTKAQKAEEGKKAMAEYEAQGIAIRAKTERLKALRLAREAEQAKIPVKPKAPAKKKAGKTAKGNAEKLSDWLDDQQKGGRRS